MHNQPIPRTCRELDFTSNIHAFPFLTFNQLPDTIYQLPTFPFCKRLSQKRLTDFGDAIVTTQNGLTVVYSYYRLTGYNQTFNQLPGMESLSVPGSNPELPEIGTVNLDRKAIETSVVPCAHSRIGAKQSESSESEVERLLIQAEPKNENM